MEENSNTKNTPVALLIDANSVRDLQSIMKAHELASKYGKIIYASLYIEEKDLAVISTMSNDLSRLGIDVKVTVGPNEINLALDAVELAYQNKVDYIFIATRRDSLIPIFIAIRRRNKKAILLAPISIPMSLKDIADEAYVI